ncbi:MAG: response regulator [Acidobacteria bacterium]|nr:response regulator [Acidobacteriota bacterium]MCZ6877991.1 response regulator [Acidobacteriota bacterium]
MRKLQDKKEEQEKKIAVIEEVADNIYSIKFILQSIGYEVTSVASRDSYQPMLKEFLPDLIIIDMMIAGGGGYEAIRQLGKSSLKKVPILAITAEAMEGKEEDVYQAGGQDTLCKPYSVQDLKKKLKKWLA